jgi:hypothetical protein
MYDLNDAQPQMGPIGELIHDGTFAKIKLATRPGGVNGAVPMDAGLLKASNSSDAKMLDCEFTVIEGPFARRKFWQNFTVAGGKVDEKGQSKGWNISKSAFRAMVDSALGLDPKDMSPAVKQKRLIQGLKQLDGIVFAARIMIEPATSPQYSDSNKLANVVLPGEPQYAAIMRGESVPPEPVKAKPRKGSPDTNGSPAPAWATQAAPAAAAPAAATTPWANQQPAAPAKPAPAQGPAWLNG